MTDAYHDPIRAIVWNDDALELLDQRVLPRKQTYLRLTDATAVAEAIRAMVVRGAPAIGITAAYAVVLAARARYAATPDGWKRAIEEDLEHLAAARPTAVNLFWALARMREVIVGLDGDPVAPLLAEARRIHAADIAANQRMGELGAALIEPGSGVLTHCNAGSLATGGYGTALGVIRSAYDAGRIGAVYADETRPWLQGSRLTAWELAQDRIPVSLIADSASAYLMSLGKLHWVIVGADRIAANGDVANKIGTYNAAVVARFHGLRFMVVAPTSSIDLTVRSGADIPIETRAADELLSVAGQRQGPDGTEVWNPVFDITPATLIDAIVTEKGIVERPNTAKMKRLMNAY